ncbi:MAG: DUF6029 family protein [Melioribacteraceae bacterium]|nr:DUF6029 family protein [Melioribacteraceae bacterium]
MKIFLLILILFFNSILLSQQISYSLSNNLRAGTGKENFGEAGFLGSTNKKYFDYYTDLKLFYNDFSAGIRYEYVNPPEYSLIKNKISRKFIEYNNYGFKARIGNSFKLFERGLSLNLFENRSLGFDTNLEGLNIDYNSQTIKWNLIWGTIDFVEPTTIFTDNPRIENYLLKGTRIEINIRKNFSLSGGLLFSQNKFPQLNENIFLESKTYLPEVSLKYKSTSFDFLFNIVNKINKENESNSYGSGIYSYISFIEENFGLTLEFKDYRFDIADPFKELNQFRSTRMLPFQNPPTVHKEHTFTLLTRYPHIVNFNDETGFQLDIFYSPNERTNYNFNFSTASRHFSFLLDKTNFRFVKNQNRFSFFPSLSNEFNPFFEIYFEGEYLLEKSESLIKAAVNYRSDIYYDVVSETNKVQPLKQFTIPIYLQYLFNEKFSLKVSNESQWILKYPKREYFFNNLISLQTVFNSNLTIGGRLEFTTNNDEPNGDKFWLVSEIGYRLNTNHIFSISYGSERGGQICSNGLCRQVLPFNGLRFSLISNI